MVALIKVNKVIDKLKCCTPVAETQRTKLSATLSG